MYSMIRNYKILQEFEEKYIASSKLSYTQALAIFEDMWRECRDVNPSAFDDPLWGIEVDIKLARILNTCSKNS